MQQQGGDYNSSYYQHHHHHQQQPLYHPPPPPPPPSQFPNPNPNDLQPVTATYASAPPFAPNYTSDYSNYPSSYPPYPQNPDPVPAHPPTAPSYAPNPQYSSSFNPAPPPEHPAPEHSSLYTAPSQPQPPPHYYPPYDQHQAPSVYTPPPPVTVPSNPSPTPPQSYLNSYGSLGSSIPPPYESSPYESNLKFDSRGDITNRYGDQSVYGRSRSDVGMDYYDKRPETGVLYDRSAIQDDFRGQNVYAYNGGKTEPYGARGTGGKSSSFAAFDDYGRSLSGPGKDQVVANKVMKAVPKVETQQDVKNGVQKFRVKLLAETGGQNMDVLCQIGLDGIRMLDPSTSRTLRIYPLETVTRSEVLDSSIFAFWSKSTVDIEPRRIRLKSNSYTTNTILDTVTAATIQLKEIGGKDSLRDRYSDPGKQSEQSSEKKKGFTDWVNMIKPGNEEKDHWVPDEAVTKCTACATDFGAFVRRHHCRNCGDIFCDKCTHGRIALTAEENAQPVRVCDRCLAEVTQRLSNAKESSSKPALCSHEDLAKKLQEEMDRNRKASSGSKSSDGPGRRMKEVACPTCTVHLQVQVPTSGSETIECGVCQHPFLVSAH